MNFGGRKIVFLVLFKYHTLTSVYMLVLLSLLTSLLEQAIILWSASIHFSLLMASQFSLGEPPLLHWGSLVQCYMQLSAPHWRDQGGQVLALTVSITRKRACDRSPAMEAHFCRTLAHEQMTSWLKNAWSTFFPGTLPPQPPVPTMRPLFLCFCLLDFQGCFVSTHSQNWFCSLPADSLSPLNPYNYDPPVPNVILSSSKGYIKINYVSCPAFENWRHE